MTDLDAFLTRGRAAAEELQREEVAIRPPAEGGFDWETGQDAPASENAIYTGQARVKPIARARGEEVDAGEANVTLREYTVSIPWSLYPPEQRVVPGYVVDVLASPDLRMVGLRLWVTGVEYSATATAWRISAEDRS